MTDAMMKLVEDFEGSQYHYTILGTSERFRTAQECRANLIAAVEALEKEVEQYRYLGRQTISSEIGFNV